MTNKTKLIEPLKTNGDKWTTVFWIPWLAYVEYVNSVYKKLWTTSDIAHPIYSLINQS